MAARPRKPGRRDLPPNLYLSSGYYRYRRPDTGTWHQMGIDKTRAIAAAKTLNARLLQGPADLVGAVLDATPSITVGDFIDTYKTVELPPRKLSAATLELYGVRLRQVQQAWGDKPLDSVTLRMVNDLLDSLTDRSSNQMRALLVDFFGYAVSKGLCPDNPAAETRVKIETKQRKRHTVEGLALIRAAAEPWLQNAIDLAMLTAQRRADLLALRWSDIRGGMIHIAQQKTTDADSDELDDLQGAGFVAIRINPALQAVLDRCRDDVASPFVLHRQPDRLDSKQRAQKQHWTQIEPRYLTRAFKAARDRANAYPDLSDAQQPGYHQIRALAIYLLKKSGLDAQATAGHSSARMTRKYADGHGVIWNVVDGWQGLPWA